MGVLTQYLLVTTDTHAQDLLEPWQQFVSSVVPAVILLLLPSLDTPSSLTGRNPSINIQTYTSVCNISPTLITKTEMHFLTMVSKVGLMMLV